MPNSIYIFNFQEYLVLLEMSWGERWLFHIRVRGRLIKIRFKNSQTLFSFFHRVRFQPKLARPSATFRNRNLSQKKNPRINSGKYFKQILVWDCCRPWRKKFKIDSFFCVVVCPWSSKIHSHCDYVLCAVSHFIHDNNVETIVSRSKCQPTRCGYCAWCDVVTVAL